MEELYKVFPWHEDPESFRLRIEEGLSFFRRLLQHEWAKQTLEATNITSGGQVGILDLMGGVGVGGVSLSLALKETGLNPDLTILDVRITALEKAKEYSRKYLGKEATTIRARAEDVATSASCPYDVILIYGLSTPHLDPYQLTRTAAGMARCLVPHGIVLVEEHDRIYGILYLTGYKQVFPEEAGKESLVVSYHAGYNVNRGVFRRLIVNQYTEERVMAEARFWDIAGVAGILWAFFEDVDYQSLEGRWDRGFILARGPRGIDYKMYTNYPKITATTY